MITHSITMLVPEASVKEAAKIFQALDPDVGGIHSFGPPDKKGMCYASMPCSEELALQFDKMMAEPAKLEEFVNADYDKRWKPTEETKVAISKDLLLKERYARLDYAKVPSLKAVADITTIDKEAILLKYDPVILKEEVVKEEIIQDPIVKDPIVKGG